jgi:hypothetical protein
MMERLTGRSDTGHAYYPRCFEEPCGGDGCKIKDCLFDITICERLAKYEDTGMEPEEVAALKKDWSDLCTVIGECGGIDRMRELAESDKDGRMVLLPCKVGDTVYRIVRDADPHITRDEVRNMYFADDMTLCVELISGRIILPEKFGKTVFLTCEEAEKALGAMKK